MNAATKLRLLDLLKAHKEKELTKIPYSLPAPTSIQSIQSTTTDRHGKSITYNDKQQSFINITSSGASAVLIGAAGTGKTTCQKGVVQSLITSGIAGTLSPQGHKHLREGTPGIVICAYTRRAVANIRKNVSEDMQSNCITIHKLLEYQPTYYSVFDETTGEEKTKMAFEPTRTAVKPLPSSIRVIIFEESSMLGVDLYKEVISACPHKPQLIFLGDIQQLPPIFGPAILGFKLNELPVIELTDVYRQALESPIIRLAHRILSGSGISVKEFPDWQIPSKLTIKPWKKKIDALNALNTLGLMFCGNSHTESDPARQVKGLIEVGAYNPSEDMILLPFNKSCGTEELNKIIGNYLAKTSKSTVYQVIAGFNKHHFCVGEKVLYDKEDAIIVRIERSPSYSGVNPAPPSLTLDYWGFDPMRSSQDTSGPDDEDRVDFLLSQVASSDSSDESRVQQASHIITLRMLDSEEEIHISRASDINSLLLGYALTVHKAQGSEWRKVFFILHQSHATMIQRELLYTAVTRAKEELFIVCEPESFVNGIKSQRVKGDTLKEKAEFFKGKIDAGFSLDSD